MFKLSLRQTIEKSKFVTDFDFFYYIFERWVFPLKLLDRFGVDFDRIMKDV